MPVKEQVAEEKCVDSTCALMMEEYLFINNRINKFQSDVFKTSLFGQSVICMSGQEAAKVFYDAEKFVKSGAVPKRIQKTLFGENAIQTMDGPDHLHRKKLFMSLMTEPQQKRLAEIINNELDTSISHWEKLKRVILFDEAKVILCKAVCQWAGVPLMAADAIERAENFSDMIDAFGAVGPRHWLGRKARCETENWIKGIIEDLRTGKISAPQDGALYAMAFYKDLNGNSLDLQMAAMELINVLRPIVAVSTYIAFAALALHEYSECKDKLLSGFSGYLDMFTEEVRRFYPFAPFLGGRVKTSFVWNQCEFEQGTLVLLDLYGTNHDSRIWSNPNKFQPERFVGWKSTLFDFIPQGGSDPAAGHRCPGEGITDIVLKTFIDFLINKITYEVPVQDLSYSLVRIPALLKSGFIMSNVMRK